MMAFFDELRRGLTMWVGDYHSGRELVKGAERIWFVGNGGSAGIASHMAIDYTKNGGKRALAFNDAAAITCLANDYSFTEIFSRQVEKHAKEGDLLVAISSSGKSENILEAVRAAKEKGIKVMTLSGFDPKNPLRRMGDVNFHVPFHDYGVVEITHLAILHSMVDA